MTHAGWPGKDTATSVSPTREAIATPFHWSRPCTANSYPAVAKASRGNCSGLHLISCMASTSMSWRSRKAMMRSMRVRAELTFQVARRMRSG